MANIPAVGYKGVIRGRDARVWIWEGTPTPENCPVLYNCVIPGGVDYSANVTTVRRECPSPDVRGRFVIVEQFSYQEDPDITASLQARLPAEAASLMWRLTEEECDFSMVWAYSSCGRPGDFSSFDRLEVFNGVRVTDYSHDEVGGFDESTLGDDVLETIDLQVLEYFEYVKPTLQNAYVITDDQVVLGSIDTVYSEDICPDGDCTSRVIKSCDWLIGVQWRGDTANAIDAADMEIVWSSNGGRTWNVRTTNVTTNDLTVSVIAQISNVIVQGNRVLVMGRHTGSNIYEYRLGDILGATTGLLTPRAVISTDDIGGNPDHDIQNISDVAADPEGNIYFTGHNLGQQVSVVARYNSSTREVTYLTQTEVAVGAAFPAQRISVVGTRDFYVYHTHSNTFGELQFLQDEVVVWTSSLPVLPIDSGNDFIIGIDSRNVLAIDSGPGDVYHTSDRGVTWNQVSSGVTGLNPSANALVDSPFVYMAQSNVTDGEVGLSVTYDMFCTDLEYVGGAPYEPPAGTNSTDGVAQVIKCSDGIIVQGPKSVLHYA